MHSLICFLWSSDCFYSLQIQDFLQTYFLMIETVSLEELDYWEVLETHLSIVQVFQSGHFLMLCWSLIFARPVVK